MDGTGNGSPVGTPQRKWLRFGVVIAILHALFLVLVVGLLRIDQTLGLVVAVSLSVVSGIAIVLFVLYVY